MKMRRIVCVVDVPAHTITPVQVESWVRSNLCAHDIVRVSTVTAAYEVAPKEPPHVKKA